MSQLTEVEILELKIKELQAKNKVLTQARDGWEAKHRENLEKSRVRFNRLTEETERYRERTVVAETKLQALEERVKFYRKEVEQQTERAEKAEAATGGLYQWGSVYIPEEHMTERFQLIVEGVLTPMIKAFAAKSASYQTSRGDIADNFGTAGQYMKMYDKIHKLERPLFDDRGKGEELEFEPVLEVLSDLFGHVLLAAIKYLEIRDGMEEDVEETL